jgi:hypothetical protein
MDVHFGPLLGTMLGKAEGASDGLALATAWHKCLMKLKEPVMGLHLGRCLAQCMMKLKGHGWTYTGPLLCTLLDEVEGGNDGHALGPLLGTMLDETEEAMDGLSTGAITWRHAG